MGHWNDILPEYRRLCFDWTPHYDTIYPYRDFKNQIYKTPAAADNLGENRWWYNTSTNEILESDININENQSWWNNPPSDEYFDPRSVLFHEMGHSVGLNHSEYSAAVMYYALSPGITKWDLTTDDINGAAAAY